MQTFETLENLSAELSNIRQANKSIGLVPTMGHLHKGHLSLVEAAKEHCDYVLATIFVNPMQFGPNEDFDNYPKTIEHDKEQLEQVSCDALFIPSVQTMYPKGLEQQTIVSVPELASIHCGKSRPVHFNGVCTVVSKLFNLTHPNKAFFGAKDFQQLLIIKRMTLDLCMPIEVLGVPIMREDSGLAMSSRNSYLSSDEKKIASQLYASLITTRDEIINNGVSHFQDIEAKAKKEITDAGMTIDFFNVCNATTLQAASSNDKHLVILAAVYLGNTRLIDNIEFIKP